MFLVIRVLFAGLLLSVSLTIVSAQSNLSAKANAFQPQPAALDGAGESDRTRDGLFGPVRRIRTELVKVSSAAGKAVEESKRILLETAEYDLKGSKTQNQYFPIEGANLTGREVYKYDDKGNISEMTLLNADGSPASREVYKYDYDSIGNWVKMTTSVAVVENGRLGFDPTEVTYRTIFYYLDATMSKMLEPANRNASPLPATTEVKAMAAALPPPTSISKLRIASVSPVSGELGSRSDKPASVTANENDPPPMPRPLMKPVSGGVLNGKALSLPAPAYPEFARRTRTGGLVSIEVIVDESGKVISARAVDGPPALRDVAVQAALHARFSPTKLSGQPVKIAGRIDYNFTIPR